MAAPSSATDRAPKREIIPPTIQRPRVSIGEWIDAAIVAGTKKIPEPRIAPTLTMVVSPKLRARFSSSFECTPPI